MSNQFESGGELPGQLASTTPAVDFNSGTAQSRMIIQSVQDDIKSIKSDIKEIRSDINLIKVDILNRFVQILMIYGAGFVAILGIFYYGSNRLEDKIAKDIGELRVGIVKLDDGYRRGEISSSKIETKLDDLLQRIPPVQSAAPTTTPKN